MSEAIRLYAGCQGGVVVYRSQDGDWQQISHNFPEGILDSLSGCVKRPERVFAGIAHDGVYRTDDGGKNWTKVLRGDVRSVTVDPNADEVVYAGTEPVHLWRSEDGGDSWEEMSSLMAFAISQGIKNYQTFVVPRDKQPESVKKKWWFIMPPFSPHITNIFVHPDDSKKIYLSIEHGGVMRTLDGGRTWEDVSRGIDYLDIHQVKCLPHSSTRYYASTARGFFASDDPAAGWIARGEWVHARLFPQLHVHAVRQEQGAKNSDHALHDGRSIAALLGPAGQRPCGIVSQLGRRSILAPRRRRKRICRDPCSHGVGAGNTPP